MRKEYRNISIAITHIWIGFVCAISFMEAWLKFQAPGIDTKLGLGIGQLVFSALNKVEITCALVIILILNLIKFKNRSYFPPISILIVFVILIVQSIWFLPYLDTRANHIINGIQVQDSYVHVVFIILEIIKVICLFLFGIKFFKITPK